MINTIFVVLIACTMKVVVRISLIIIFTIYTGLELKAQYAVKNISNTKGLSNSSINCMYEDSKKILWIGTWDGLNSYDGREIKVYKFNRNNPHSLDNNIVRQIVEENSRYLWIYTDNGPNRFDRTTQNFDSYPVKGLSSIIITGKKKVMLCSRSSHLLFLDQKQNKFLPVKNKNAIKSIRKILCTTTDLLYILSSEGQLFRYNIVYGESSIELKIIDEEPITGVRDICSYDENVYINFGKSIGVINDESYNPHLFNIPSDKSIDLFSANRYTVYTWLSDGKSYAYKIRSCRGFFLDSVPQMNGIFSLYAGSQDILWIGTDGKGIIYAYPDNSFFKTIKTNAPVRAICERDNGDILVGTKGEGIKVLDKETGNVKYSYTENNGLISNVVYAIKKNINGDIFIGTEGAGLNILRNGTSKIEFLPLSTTSYKSIYCITFTSHDSYAWLGSSSSGILRLKLSTKNGMYTIDDEKAYNTGSNKEDLRSNTVYSIIKGRQDDELWIGARYGGVYQMLTGSDKIYPLEKLMKSSLNMDEDVLSLNLSANNDLWVGTSYGLNKIVLDQDSAYITEYTDKEGLTNNTIHGILEDGNHNIWISTNHGISCIDHNTNKITNYTSRDGLQNDEFADCAYYKGSDGLLYFGGINGVSYFNPNNVQLRDYTPPISLNSLKINNANQNISERVENNTLKLSYDEPYVLLSLTVQDFINNENCEYKYRIKGFVDEWIDNYNNSNINITRLPPGKYTLEVKYTNGDRVWSDNIYTLNLVVGYPWWQSPLAYLIYTLIVIILIVVTVWIIRYKMLLNRKIYIEQLEKQHQEKIHESKLNFFTNIAHEFFTPLTLIYGPANYLLDNERLDNTSKKYVNVIKQNADRMQKLINELMDFRKAESGYTKMYAEKINMEFLIKYVTDNYTGLAEENKIDFKIEMDNLSEFISDRNSLEIVLFNLISNAFKYTPTNGYIHVNVTQEIENGDQRLKFVIRNSGRGLTESQMAEIFDQFKIMEKTKKTNFRSTGLGLNLTKSLTNLLGGSLDVDSILDEYVEFKLILNPLKYSENELYVDKIAIPDYPSLKIKERQVSILIVEDDRYICDLLEDILKPYYKVTKTYDGLEGWTEVSKNMYDIIITDIMMPDMDGIELITRIKTNEQFSHIPIISISAKSSIEDSINAYEHGADLYITKPFHPRHVLVAVENIINKHSLLKEYYNSGRSSIVVKEGIEIHQEDEQFLIEIISYIENNLDDESLGPNSIADYLKVSKATLYRKLKEITEKTPSEYIRYIKLKNTAVLLKTSKASVTEIMYKSGFSNKSYFFREFAKQYGCTPKEYRNKPE